MTENCHPANSRFVAWNSTADLVLTLLPVMILKDLNMEVRTKIVLCVVMGMSIFAMVACIVKTVELRALGDKEDFTYNTARFVIWFTIEQYVVIIAASIPTIRPLALKVSQKWKNRTPIGGSVDSIGLQRRTPRVPCPIDVPDGSNDLSWSDASPLHPIRLSTPSFDNLVGRVEVEPPYVHPSPETAPPLGTIRKTISVVIRWASTDENITQTQGVQTTISAGPITPEPGIVTPKDNAWPFPHDEEAQ